MAPIEDQASGIAPQVDRLHDAAVRPDLDLFVSTSYASVQNEFNNNDNSIFSPILNALLGEGYYIPQSTKSATALAGESRGN